MSRPRLTMLNPRSHILRPTMRNAPSADSWRSGKTTAERGYDNRWRRARDNYLHRHPLCAMCEAEGRVRAATVVDHKTPHRGDQTLFWDETNWQSLCATHHSSDKQREERGGQPRRRVGFDGWPE